MTPARPAPPLPSPQRPASAARTVAQAAQAAARAWAQPLTPAGQSRAVSQLHSALRDLGIAARSLAAYQAGTPPHDVPSQVFRDSSEAGSRLLLEAWQRLDDVLAAEGIPPSGDPDEPGAALCQAARGAILAWRQPSGTAAERDGTARELATATGHIFRAITSLTACAPRRLAIGLTAAADNLVQATAAFTAAISHGEDPDSFVSMPPPPGAQLVPPGSPSAVAPALPPRKPERPSQRGRR